MEKYIGILRPVRQISLTLIEGLRRHLLHVSYVMSPLVNGFGAQLCYFVLLQASSYRLAQFLYHCINIISRTIYGNAVVWGLIMHFYQSNMMLLILSHSWSLKSKHKFITGKISSNLIHSEPK